MGCDSEGRRSQFIEAPIKTVVDARKRVGVRKLGFSPWVECRGDRVAGPQSTEIASRVEYAAVSTVARIKMKMIRQLVGLNKSISRIRSLE